MTDNLQTPDIQENEIDNQSYDITYEEFQKIILQCKEEKSIFINNRIALEKFVIGKCKELLEQNTISLSDLSEVIGDMLQRHTTEEIIINRLTILYKTGKASFIVMSELLKSQEVITEDEFETLKFWTLRTKAPKHDSAPKLRYRPCDRRPDRSEYIKKTAEEIEAEKEKMRAAKVRAKKEKKFCYIVIAAFIILAVVVITGRLVLLN